jgi:predicted transcriptional regulator
MQEFLLELLFRGKMMKRDQKFYRSNIAFYRTVSYLKIAGMIESTKKEQFNEYFLTERGTEFAMWISFLPDNHFVVAEHEKRHGKNDEREGVKLGRTLKGELVL